MGQLSLEEVAELHELGETSEEYAYCFALFWPLGEDFKSRVSELLLRRQKETAR